MSWSDEPPDVRAAAERLLTAKQLEVYRLRAQGLSWTALALHMGVDRTTVRQRWTRAHQIIEQEVASCRG